MANPTMTLIASNTVGSGGVASVTFSSIPAIYTDLLIKVSMRINDPSADGPTVIQFNGTTTGYSSKELDGNGTSANSYSRGVMNNGLFLGNLQGNSATASTFSNTDIYIPNYTSSNAKSVSIDSVSENNATTAWAVLNAGLSTSTSTIASISIYGYYSNAFLQYSTFYLYGIKNS